MRLALHVVSLSTSSGVKRSHVITTAFSCLGRQIDTCCLKVAIFFKKKNINLVNLYTWKKKKNWQRLLRKSIPWHCFEEVCAKIL